MAYGDLSAEQRARRNRSNAASRARYEAKAYDRLQIRVRRDGGDGCTLEQIRTAAAREGLSVNAFCLACLRDKI